MSCSHIWLKTPTRLFVKFALYVIQSVIHASSVVIWKYHPDWRSYSYLRQVHTHTGIQYLPTFWHTAHWSKLISIQYIVIIHSQCLLLLLQSAIWQLSLLRSCVWRHVPPIVFCRSWHNLFQSWTAGVVLTTDESMYWQLIHAITTW